MSMRRIKSRVVCAEIKSASKNHSLTAKTTSCATVDGVDCFTFSRSLLLRNWIQLSFVQALFGSTATAVIAGLAAMKPYYDEFRKSWTVLKKKDEAIQNDGSNRSPSLKTRFKS
jgi:hypothetical protein